MKKILRETAAFDEVLKINSEMHDSYTDEEKIEIHAILCISNAGDLYTPHPEVQYPETVLTHLKQ